MLNNVYCYLCNYMCARSFMVCINDKSIKFAGGVKLAYSLDNTMLAGYLCTLPMHSALRLCTLYCASVHCTIPGNLCTAPVYSEVCLCTVCCAWVLYTGPMYSVLRRCTLYCASKFYCACVLCTAPVYSVLRLCTLHGGVLTVTLSSGCPANTDTAVPVYYALRLYTLYCACVLYTVGFSP